MAGAGGGVPLFEKEYHCALRRAGDGRKSARGHRRRWRPVISERATMDERIQLMRHGLELDGQLLRPAIVEPFVLEKGSADVVGVHAGTAAADALHGAFGLRIVLRQGRNRQIRRMARLVGLEVCALHRVRVGPFTLGDLPSGHWRVPFDSELEWIASPSIN